MDPSTQRKHRTALLELDDKFETALSAFATAAGERCDEIDAKIAALDEGLSTRIDGVQVDVNKEVEAIFVVLRRESLATTAAIAAATEPLRRNFWGRLLWALGWK